MERYLGVPASSAQEPDFGSWELKVVPLKRLRKGDIQVKEAMAITMIDPADVMAKEFEQSHLCSKLSKIVTASRIFESQAENSSTLYAVVDFDLNDPSIYRQIKADYDLVRHTVRTQGFGALTGKMGVLVQPRTKGAGHGRTSRAFYA